MLASFTSLYDLFEAFPDEQSCLDHFRAIRWCDGEFCPYCGDGRIYHFSDRKTFKCGACRQRFSIKVGTIFEDTKLPLRKWFAAIWMISNHPKGVASTTLSKDLKITQKTAWFVLHRLRHAARTDSFNAPLKGPAESDTTFIGGKEGNKHADKRTPNAKGGKGKAVVLGVLERQGELRAQHIPAENIENIHGFIKENLEAGADLMTDEDRMFKGLRHHYNLQMVKHALGEYVRGDVYNNGVESVWALLKRQIVGIHHWVSPKHLQKYVDEMTWRFNRRDMKPSPRMNDLFACANGRRLTYKALIG